MTPIRKTFPRPAVVSGHICLDVIPALRAREGDVAALLAPGKLIDVGAAVLSTGGAVSNTGIALHRIGVPVRLAGKVGGDLFGRAILDIVRGHGRELADGMIVAEGEASSYTIVISPPGIDRIFLHCPGANDTFAASDVPEEALREAGLFHFGYPPLMRRMYEDGGAELEALLSAAKAAGATVSLDLARPDPDSPSGRADWRAILARALPHVDLFLPSLEEILFMLRRDVYDELSARAAAAASVGVAGAGGDASGGAAASAGGAASAVGDAPADVLAFADEALLSSLADELLSLGAAVAVIKLGEYGLYLKTSPSPQRIAAAGYYAPKDLAAWTGRELYAPCFQAEVAGTTGAGDCTIAGLLAGWMQGLPPEKALLGAVGVGACNVERPDAVSGVRPWEEVQRRIAGGWPQHAPKLAAFRAAETPLGARIWRGPRDGA